MGPVLKGKDTLKMPLLNESCKSLIKPIGMEVLKEAQTIFSSSWVPNFIRLL